MNAKSLHARRFLRVFALVTTFLAFGATARSQLTTEEDRLKILTDPESVKKKLDKEKTRPPIEFFRSQVAPFDILPYVKPNHWSTITLEMRANYADYVGSLQTNPIMLLGLPQEMVYRRDARLTKAQQSRVALQVLLPKIPPTMNLELMQPDAIRPDESWQASLKTLEPHQMLILFLTKESNDAYAGWKRFQALYPQSLDRGDVQAADRMLYYRLVLPLEPDKPPLASHPLTWSTISHVVWDGMSPDNLNPSQQQAMLDWLHWGGQLTVVGGATTSFSILKDSFLGPYLPAEATGENALLGRAELKPLSDAYPPPWISPESLGDDEPKISEIEPSQRLNDRYRKPMAIKPVPSQPIFFAGLKAKPGAIGIPLDESGKVLLGVEQRVGRGRVLMLAFNPTDRAIASWPGLDTLVRRVVLRRPEENRDSRVRPTRPGANYASLHGSDLSWLRYLSRDFGEMLPREPRAKPDEALSPKTDPDILSTFEESPEEEDLDYRSPENAVAEWIDSSALPRLCRDVLEEASGIKVPSASFVLNVVLAYIFALVPLNWLICRYLLRRRELAWVVVPVLSLGFAVGVERAAAYDLGYNSSCDEIDVFEAYGGYPRAHVTRFSSLYSTGRTRFRISFPDDPTALALPLDHGRSLRGEDIVTSVWQSFPVPALEGFLVQPRSLGMIRAEQMVTLEGAISLVTEEGVRKVVNAGGLELRDAVIVEVSADRRRKEIRLGTIAPGSSVEVKEVPVPVSLSTAADALRPQKFLKEFRNSYEDRPENHGEIRLVAWTPMAYPGQKVEPAVDQHRGLTAVVVHLRNGQPPSPDGPTYNALAKGFVETHRVVAPAPAKSETVPGKKSGIFHPAPPRR